MDTKKWYASKLVWTGVATTILGILPLILAFIQVVSPQSALIASAVIALVSGVITIITRVWFTDTPIER